MTRRPSTSLGELGARVKGRLPPQLVRCPGCGLHLYQHAKQCPHCKGDLVALGRKQLRAIKKAQAAVARLAEIFDR